MGLKDGMAELLASECGGEPEDYEADLSDMRSLDEAAAEEGEIDLSADEVPIQFDDINLEDAEEVSRTTA